MCVAILVVMEQPLGGFDFIMNILILAGGLGTRLRSVIGDIPKPVALIHGKPFLYFLLKYLEQFLPKSVTISLCYEPDKVKNALKSYSFSYPLNFLINKG